MTEPIVRKLKSSGFVLLTGAALLILVSVWAFGKFFVFETRPSMHSDDGPIRRTEVLSQTFEINRRYKSMEGPWEIQRVKLDPSTSEVVWLKGIQTEIVDPTNERKVFQEFMCHFNIDVDHIEHARFFNEFTRGSTRVVSLSQGLMRYQLPEGYGVPFHSQEDLRFTMQVLNHNFDGHYAVKHRVSAFFIRESERKSPIQAVYHDGAFVMKQTSGPPGHYREGATSACSCCDDVEFGKIARQAGKETEFRDELSRVFVGHWAIPPGETYSHTSAHGLLNLPYETKVVGLLPHVHPFATELVLNEILPDCNRAVVYKANVVNPVGRVGLSHLDSYADAQGLALDPQKKYEVAVSYNNISGEEQDSMASFFLFLVDKKFKMPTNPEVLAGFNDDQSNRVVTGDSGEMTCGFPLPPSPGLATAAMRPNTDEFVPNAAEVKRAMIKTPFGELEFEVYPDAAPEYAKQFIWMAQNGVLDQTQIFRIMREGYVEFGGHHLRRHPLADEVRRQIRSLPQAKTKLSHHKYSLTMVNDSDRNMTSAFSLLLREAPEWDSKYVVFGKLIRGEEVLKLLTSVQVNSEFRPVNQMFVEKAKILN